MIADFFQLTETTAQPGIEPPAPDQTRLEQAQAGTGSA